MIKASIKTISCYIVIPYLKHMVDAFFHFSDSASFVFKHHILLTGHINPLN